MNRGLLMLAGHAIYQRKGARISAPPLKNQNRKILAARGAPFCAIPGEPGRWHGGHQNEDRLYEEHVRDAFRIYRADGYQALALSGGRSRPHLPLTNSEAEGMLEYAHDAKLVQPDDEVLLERYGRDSFENLFFSMLAFHRRYGEWPTRVGAVSWKFKALRFYLIACGLRLNQFRFYGSGDPVSFEQFAIASVEYDSMIVRGGEIIDPLQRDPQWFAAKRLGRTPNEFSASDYLEHVKQEYGHADLIDQVEATQPGPAWRDISWPWQ